MHLLSSLSSYACSCLVLLLIQPVYSASLPSSVKSTNSAKTALTVFDEVQEHLILAINHANDSTAWDAADKGFQYSLHSIAADESAEMINVFGLTLDSDSSSEDDATQEEEHKEEEKPEAIINIRAGVNPVSDSTVGCIYISRLKDGTTGEMLLSAMRIAEPAKLRSSKQWVVDTLNQLVNNGLLVSSPSFDFLTSLDYFKAVQGYADLLYNNMKAGHIEPTEFCSMAEMIRGSNGELQVRQVNELTLQLYSNLPTQVRSALEKGIGGQQTFTYISIAVYNDKNITFEQAKQQLQWGGNVDSATRAYDETFRSAVLASSEKSPQSHIMMLTRTTSEAGVYGIDVRDEVNPAEQELLITIIVVGELKKPMTKKELVDGSVKVLGSHDVEDDYGDDRCSTSICIILWRLRKNKLLPAIEHIKLADLESVVLNKTMEVLKEMDKTKLALEERITEINIDLNEESQIDEGGERAESEEKSEGEEKTEQTDGRNTPEQRLRRSIRVPPQSPNTNTSAMSLHSLFGRGIECWGTRKSTRNSLFSKSTTGKPMKGLGAGRSVYLSVEKLSGQSGGFRLGGVAKNEISTVPKNVVPPSRATGMIKFPGPPPVRATQAVRAVAIASSDFSLGTKPGKGEPRRFGVSPPPPGSSKIQINYLFFQDWVARKLHDMKLDHKLKGWRVGGASLYSIIFRQIKFASVFVQGAVKLFRAIIQTYMVFNLVMMPIAIVGGLISMIQALSSNASVEEKRMMGSGFIPLVGCVAHKNYLEKTNPAGVNKGMHNAAHGLCISGDIFLFTPIGVVLKVIEMIVRAVSKVDEFETENLQIEYEEQWKEGFNKKFEEYQTLLQSDSYITEINMALQAQIFADVARFGLVATALYTASGQPVLPQKLAEDSVSGSDQSNPVKFIGKFSDFNGSMALNLTICRHYRTIKEKLVHVNLQEVEESIDEMRKNSLAEYKKQKINSILIPKLKEAEKQPANFNYAKSQKKIDDEKEKIRKDIQKASEKGFAGVKVAKDIWREKDFFKNDILRRIRNAITYIPDWCKPTCDHYLDGAPHMCFFDNCQSIKSGLGRHQLLKLGYSRVPQSGLDPGQDAGHGGCQQAGRNYCGLMAPHSVPFPPYRYGPNFYCLKVNDEAIDKGKNSSVDIDLPDPTNAELVLRRWLGSPVYAENVQEATNNLNKLYEFHDTNVTVEVLKSEQQHEQVRRGAWLEHFQTFHDGAKNDNAALEVADLRVMVEYLRNETVTQLIWLRRENYLEDMLSLKNAEVVNKDDGTKPPIFYDESKINLRSTKSSEQGTKTEPLSEKLTLRLNKLSNILEEIEKNANDKSALPSIMKRILEEWPSPSDWSSGGQNEEIRERKNKE